LPKRILGALFGTQVGRVINVLGSFEAKLKLNTKTSEVEELDYKFLDDKMKLLKQANFYRECEFLGWYSTIPDMKPLSKDLNIHKGFYFMNENPIYLCFDPKKQIKGYDLPIKLYEAKFTQQEKTTIETLAEVSFDIETPKTEIISVEHLSKNVASADNSLFADGMTNTVNSLQILEEKIQFLVNYIEKNPKVKEDKEFLRELKEVCINFPSRMKTGYRDDIIDEYKETSLTNMLTALLVANKTVQDVINLRPNFDIKTAKAYEDS
jgi:proteasome lid subunit RPN8/RPN11